MGNINLMTNDGRSEDAIPYKGGILSVVAVFVLLLFVYGGIYFYKGSLVKKTAAATEAYQAEKEKLISQSNNAVMDFQNRLLIATDLLAEKSMAGDSLAELEKRVVAGAYLNSFDLDRQGKKASIQGSADNFGIVAKQLSSLKNSDYFSEVTPGDSALSDNGKVEFYIDLKIK